MAAHGDTQALIPLFAVGVFVGFTLSQLGMVRHWRKQRTPGWMYRAVINGVGAVLTAVTTVIELVSKFTEGAWLIVLVIPALVLLFSRVRRTYQRIGSLLELGRMPKPPTGKKSLVIVPVSTISRLTAEGLSAAISLGGDVVAVNVEFTDGDGPAHSAAFAERWQQWRTDVPLVTLTSAHRSIAPPIVSYLCQLEASDQHHRLVVLIPEVQPRHFWDALLFNQRGAILDRAIRRGTVDVVLARLRYRLEHLAPEDGAAPAAGPGAGSPSVPG